MFPIYLIKIRDKFTAFKFFQSRLRILNLVTGTFEKKSGKKINYGKWSKNVVTLPDSISSKDIEVEKILSINVDVLEILGGKNIRGNKKLELRVSINYLLNLRIHILISQC